jgi:hypothetical protein
MLRSPRGEAATGDYSMHTLVPTERLEQSILVIRGHKVMLDRDLAHLYGTTTKAINQAVKRHRDRFRNLRHSTVLPHVCTEHGVLMLASVLNTPVAVTMSIRIVEAFVRLREMVSTHKDLARRLDALDRRYDAKFKAIFNAIRQLMLPPDQPTKRRIGFHP